MIAHALAESADGERLLSDEWHERDMRLGSLALRRAIETARGWRPVEPPPKPAHVPAVARVGVIPGEGVAQRTFRAVAAAYGLSVADLLGRSRQRRLVCARGVAIRLLRDMRWECSGEHRFSLPQIGRMLGRDHSTVCYALSVFDAYCRTYPEMREVYDALREVAP